MGELMLTPADTERFERFVMESFQDGVTSRELRLSAEEAGHVKRLFPNAVLEELSASPNTDGKTWFRVRIS